MVKHRKKLIVLILTVIFVFSWSTPLLARPTCGEPRGAISETPQVEEQEVITSNTFVKIAEEVRKKGFVVTIFVTKKGDFGEKKWGIGSGIIIDEKGYILTNNHVIEEAQEITVIFDSQTCEAQVVGSDPGTDLALLRIEPKDKLIPAPLGDSDKIKVGHWVVAIGSPLGLRLTVTHGIISAMGREFSVHPLLELIQTNAAINPGNSGGPLLNLKGEVIGINVAIAKEGQNIGFAIPINTAKEIVSILKTKGKVTRGWLGVGGTYNDNLSQVEIEIFKKRFGLEKIPKKEGILVLEIFKGSPAEKAGIKKGDIILEFDGKKLEDFRTLSKIILITEPGTVVKIKIFRYGEILEIEVKIEEKKYS